MSKELLDFEKKFSATVSIHLNNKKIKNVDLAKGLNKEPSIISKWIKGEIRIPERHLQYLQDILEIPEEDVCEYRKNIEKKNDLKMQNKTNNEDYIAESLQDIIKNGYAVDDILKEIAEIGSEWPVAEIELPFEGSNDYGGDDKWQRFILEFPDHVYLISEKSSKKCVAYWNALSITNNLYMAARNGLNINKSCSEDDLENFFIPRDHKMYLVDAFTRKNYMNSHIINKVMGRSFFKYLLDLALNGHYLTHIITHAYSKYSEKLCGSYKFEFVCPHLEHRRYESEQNRNLIPTKIYEFDMEKKCEELLSISALFLPSYEVERLRNLYNSHFSMS